MTSFNTFFILNPFKHQPTGQIHLNNSSAFADELFESDHFVGLALKGLREYVIHHFFNEQVKVIWG